MGAAFRIPVRHFAIRIAVLHFHPFFASIKRTSVRPLGGINMDDLHTATDAPRRRSGRPDKPIPRVDLIRVARVLFADHGYAGVSMADIAHALESLG